MVQPSRIRFFTAAGKTQDMDGVGDAGIDSAMSDAWCGFERFRYDRPRQAVAVGFPVGDRRAAARVPRRRFCYNVRLGVDRNG